MNEIKVFVDALINPTEDLDKIKRAVSNIFPNMPFHIESAGERDHLIAQAEGKDALDAFHLLLRQKRIRDAARKIFLRGRCGNHITFFLNKQVAFMKNISFCEPFGESPLGPIKIEIVCDDSLKVIDWLTSRSRA